MAGVLRLDRRQRFSGRNRGLSLKGLIVTIAIARGDLASIDFSDIDSGERIPRTLPGDILRHDFMEPLEVTAYELAKATGVPTNRITGILHGTRAITADTALRLADRFGTSAEFWMNLQVAYDLATARDERMVA